MPARMHVDHQTPARSVGTRARPVLLVTMDVPFDGSAVDFAIETAVEFGQRLIVANFTERAPLPLSTILGYDDLPYPPVLAASLQRPAELARSLGIDVTRIRVKSFHPIQAMIEVMSEQEPAVLVFGPDRSKLGRLRYRRAARAIRSQATTLVWLPE